MTSWLGKSTCPMLKILAQLFLFIELWEFKAKKASSNLCGERIAESKP